MDENEYYANKWSYYSNMLLWGILFKNAISEKKGIKTNQMGKGKKDFVTLLVERVLGVLTVLIVFFCNWAVY